MINSSFSLLIKDKAHSISSWQISIINTISLHIINIILISYNINSTSDHLHSQIQQENEISSPVFPTIFWAVVTKIWLKVVVSVSGCPWGYFITVRHISLRWWHLLWSMGGGGARAMASHTLLPGRGHNHNIG